MLEVRPIANHEIDRALELLSCESFSGSEEIASQVASFHEQFRRERYDLARRLAVLDNGRIVYTCFFEACHKRTVLILSPLPRILDKQTYDYQAEVIGSLSRWAFDHGSDVVEFILDSTDHSRCEICEQFGIKKLTDLVYLYRDGDAESPNHTPPDSISWLGYNEKNHSLFERIIQQSNQDSLDCPELNHFQKTDDIINSLKAAGRFEPQYWKLLMCPGPSGTSSAPPPSEPAGVLMLAPTPQRDCMELLFFGVISGMRGKGLGKTLLGEAIKSTEAFGVTSLLAAIDYRNHPARRQYEQFGFKPLYHRTVLYCCRQWQQTSP